MDYRVKRYPYHVPYFMFDLDNYQLITSAIIPGDIADTKDIILTEVPIPGMNFQPIMQGGGGNRKLSFTIPLIQRNNTVGNVLLLKQYDMLRNQVVQFGSFTTGQFTRYPRVLFYYGIGSVPLPYFVKKADATHKQGWVNETGMPQYSEINMELWLDENSPLYYAEEVFRKLSAVMGFVSGVATQVTAQKGGRAY